MTTPLRLPTAAVLFLATIALSGGLRSQPNTPDVVAVLKGHTDTVAAVALSPDGSLIATGSFDRTIRLWDTASGKELRVYSGPQGHQGLVLAVAFSPAGDLLASGGADNSVRLWDAPTATPGKVFAHSGAVNRVTVAADGKTFALAGGDGVIKVFPQGEEKGAFEVKGHEGAVTGIGFTQNNQFLISAGADRTLRFWVAGDGKAVTSYGAGPEEITGLAVNPNNQAVYTVGGGELRYWSLPPQPPKLPPAAVALSPTGAVALEAVTAKTGRPLPGTPARAVPLGSGRVAGVVVSPGGERVITLGPGKEAVSWNTGNGTRERVFEAGGEVTAAAFSKDGQRLAVGGSDGSVRVYTVGDGKLVGSIAADAPVVDLAFQPTAPVLVGVLNNKTAAAWNVAFTPGQPEFGRPLQSYPHAAAVSGVAFAADGSFLTAAEDRQARRFRVAADAPTKTLQHPNLVDSVAFDETGTQLATGCHDGNLRIWDVAKGQALKTIAAHVQTQPQNVQHPIYAVAWAPGGKQVLTASFDRSLKLWDVASGNLVKEFKAAVEPKPGEKAEPPKEPVGHRDQVFTAVFSKDGKTIATGSSDRTVKLWDVASGKVVRDFPNPDLKAPLPGEPAPSHPGWVHAVRFTPDGKFLVSAGPAPRYRGYVAVWSVADGKRVYGTELDWGAVHGLAVTPDGAKLVLGCGPKGRTASEAEVLILKTPGK
jgi:WD40 repeat protein